VRELRKAGKTVCPAVETFIYILYEIFTMEPWQVHKQLAARTSYLQYKGTWDMQDLYEFLAAYFSSHKFKFYEKRYVSKHPGPFGPETFHVWEARRNVEEYYRYIVDVFLHTFDTQNIDAVMKDGSKRNFTKGRLWAQIRGRVVIDHEGRWEEKSFYANLRSFYHKYVIQKKMEGIWWDNLQYTVVLKLQSLIKERLKMESEAYEHRYFHKVR